MPIKTFSDVQKIIPNCSKIIPIHKNQKKTTNTNKQKYSVFLSNPIDAKKKQKKKINKSKSDAMPKCYIIHILYTYVPFKSKCM